MQKEVDYKKLLNELKLELINKGLNKSLRKNNIRVLGLDLFSDDASFPGLLLIGKDELKYLDSNSAMVSRLKERLSLEKTTIIVADAMAIPNYLLDIAIQLGLWLLRSIEDLSLLYFRAYGILKEAFSTRLSMHGTFLNIHGMGVLIQGRSGIGKSETALDLIKRGHELISDDLVELYESSSGKLIGEAPDLLKHKLEIRGIGVVDVINMFGASSYYPKKSVELVIELKEFSKDESYDRLGLECNYVKILNNEIRKMVIPVLPGRNIALLVESATLKAKLIKYMAIDDSKEFVAMLDSRRRND